MSAPATVKIPIKPHLKKFVLFVMDVDEEPIRVTEKQMLGRCIIKVLQETRSHRFDNVLYTYTARIQVVLTEDMRERSPNMKRLVYINTEIENYFRESLIMWVKAQTKGGSPANEACKSFLAEMKIDDSEYSFDAAYKVWQRYNDIKRKKRSSLRAA
jgi:hypothetical protein